MSLIISITSILLTISCIFFMIKQKICLWTSLKDLFQNRKIFIMFNIWILISITFFTYSNFEKLALVLFFKDWRYLLSIVLFLIVFNQKINKTKNTVNYAMIIGLFITLFIWPFFIASENDTRPFYIILRNQLGGYITVFFPFLLSALFYYKSVVAKLILLLLIVSTFTFLFYTGLRGGLLTVLIESLIVIFYFSQNVKKFFLLILSFVLIVFATGSVAYYAVPQFQQKINQTLNNKNISSSRDLIITSRFPLIVNSTQNIIGGIGYNSVSYNQYLLDNNAQKGQSIGYYNNNKEYIYNNDEPFFLTIFYNVGAVGLLLYLASLFVSLKGIHQSIKLRKDIFNISFMAFGIGYFLIFCSFELISMKVFILFSLLSILCMKKELNN